jgi:hypothetical protein
VESDIGELIVRYLQESREDCAHDHRILRTALLFLKPDDERVVEVLRRNAQIDSDLVRGLTAVASPIEIAVVLEQMGAHLPPECFADHLLDSPDKYARLVGLKLLRRFHQDPFVSGGHGLDQCGGERWTG